MSQSPAPLEYCTQDSAVAEGEETQENYVATTGEFHSRLQHWLATLNITDMYPVQLAIVFKAGAVVNLNMISKDGRRFKEVVTKYMAKL